MRSRKGVRVIVTTGKPGKGLEATVERGNPDMGTVKMGGTHRIADAMHFEKVQDCLALGLDPRRVIINPDAFK